MSASQRFFESLACLTELRYCRIDLDKTRYVVRRLYERQHAIYLSSFRPTFDSDVILRIVDNAPHLIAFHLFCHSSASIRAQCSAMIQSRLPSLWKCNINMRCFYLEGGNPCMFLSDQVQGGMFAIIGKRGDRCLAKI